MGNATLYGSIGAISAALCFLRSGIIGLGALLAGIGITMLIIEIKYNRVEKSPSVLTFY